MSKKIINGGRTGLKQDKFRHSKFELNPENTEDYHYGGMTQKTSNTLGGPFDENSGRRTADVSISSRWNGPFENGRLTNWKNREGWDSLYDRSFEKGSRQYGGNQLDHEGSHFGKGPRGYQRSDESIYDDVCYTLTASHEVDASQIEVKVQKGIVYLLGSVPDRRTKKIAEIEVESISGVKDVQNQLSFLPTKEGKEIH